MFKNVFFLLLAISMTIVSSHKHRRRGPIFRFYSQPNHKVLKAEAEPAFDNCFNIGSFRSAIFRAPKTGSVEMCSQLDCGGICVTRDMYRSFAPRDNIREYGRLFNSVVYRNYTGCSV
ncbi:hypothetical protein AYI68_g1233 [Smittium mucronatum]|uniref:Uncharacterized protein n=1 Tax=Smittium mucronatum TaxID=133383 RepID=A0A1R0H5Z0_9FUNG|nr:hypothetical protein AYI68_g1233 [Smittium mucronatum]